MTINKYQGKTEEEAVEKAKQEMGDDVVVLNVKVVKPKGFFQSFKKPTYEVTVAREEKEEKVTPMQALSSPMRMHEKIDLAADEELPLRNSTEKKELQKETETKTQQAVSKTIPEMRTQEKENQKEALAKDPLEERLETLQSFLEQQLSSEESDRRHRGETIPHLQQQEKENPEKEEGFKFLKMIYEILLDNEVNEKYVNQIIDEIEKIMRNGSSVDYILSNVYQKMILKFGQPKTISMATNGGPKVVFFIGPTGVGKTTTIAKIASKFKLEYGKKVAFLTADTYRIAAAEQLRTYANILDTPLSIIYTAEEMNEIIEKENEYDLILIDTAGFSHKSDAQKKDMQHLINSLDPQYEKEVFLVVSATTKYKDLLDITDTYKQITDYKIIFTKLDETTSYGNILNIKLYADVDLSYTTNGQNVPDDIEVFNTQKIVKHLLGGK
ncbi:MAG: flagellar biosynthesis protein FlhF [Lachnospiraceae bacterium]